MGCHFLLQCMKVKSESEVAQSCPTPSDPMDCTYQAPPSMGFSRQEYWSGLQKLKCNRKIQSQRWLLTTIENIRRRRWHPTPVLLPGKSHGRRRLVGCSPRGYEESDTTERLHFHFSLSLIGEGNGTHFSVLAWRISGMGEPGELLSMGLHRVRHD